MTARSHHRLQRAESGGRVVPLRMAVPVASTQGTLALDLEPALAPPDTLLPAGIAPAGPTPAGHHGFDADAEAWVIRFAQAALEIVSGDRPVSQLVRWTSREVYLDLQRRALLVSRAGGHHPGVARVHPVRPRVLSVHTSTPDDDVTEAGVHVRYGERSRALAGRFERRAGRWICTALEFA